MKTISTFAVAALVAFSGLTVNTFALDADLTWLDSFVGEKIAKPGPAYSGCDVTKPYFCIKTGRARVYDQINTANYTDYDFAWIPSDNIVYDNITGTSVYNVDPVNNTYDVQINTTGNTLTFVAYSLQDIIDYYNNK
jgi:hypothetical protein